KTSTEESQVGTKASEIGANSGYNRESHSSKEILEERKSASAGGDSTTTNRSNSRSNGGSGTKIVINPSNSMVKQSRTTVINLGSHKSPSNKTKVGLSSTESDHISVAVEQNSPARTGSR